MGIMKEGQLSFQAHITRTLMGITFFVFFNYLNSTYMTLVFFEFRLHVFVLFCI